MVTASAQTSEQFPEPCWGRGRTNRNLGDEEERMVFEKQVAEWGFMVS